MIKLRPNGLNLSIYLAIRERNIFVSNALFTTADSEKVVKNKGMQIKKRLMKSSNSRLTSITKTPIGQKKIDNADAVQTHGNMDLKNS